MYPLFKRLFDFLSALILFCVISPLFLIIWLLVRINLGSPAFFMQKRSGMHQKVFNIIKFRTMTDKRDDDGELLPDELRQTVFGQWLRSTSLDELPELLSIIKGDMSVIGPRPLPVDYDQYYTQYELKRFEVRGGLLPPDSVDSSVIISWNKQLEYEAIYAEKLSFKNDLKIFFATFTTLFQRKKSNYGIYIRRPLNIERKNDLR